MRNNACYPRTQMLYYLFHDYQWTQLIETWCKLNLQSWSYILDLYNVLVQIRLTTRKTKRDI